MRRAVLLAIALLGVAAAGVSLAAVTVTRGVAIRPAGFDPARRTIQTGDTIRWTNADTVDHQVVADNGHFASPVLRPRQTYERTFTTSGTYRYRDALEPAERGVIVVQGPPPSVSIALSQGTVFYGAGIRLAGVVSNGQPNQRVEIWGRPFFQASMVKIADVLTVAAGGFDWTTVPQTLSYYQARWGNRWSAVVTVGVRPRMTLIRRAPWFVTSAKVGTPLAGRWVYVQRKSRFNQWVNIKKVRLGSSGARRFKLDLRPGRHALRVFMTTNQAGSGLLWSHSRTIVVKKKR